MEASLETSNRLQGGGFPYYVLYEPTEKGTTHTVWFDGLSHAGSFSVESQRMFSQILIDGNNNYWFAEKKAKEKEKTNLYIFNEHGKFLKNVIVTGNPNLFEFDYSVFAACEGNDGKGRIYQYCIESYQLVEQWTIEGFLWDLEKMDDRLYVSSYLPGKDAAVLYVIEDKKMEKVDLGEHFFPTYLLSRGTSLYISACPILDCGEKKIIELNMNHERVDEYKLNVSPRRLYMYDGGLIIHTLELASGKKEKLIYYDFKTGDQKVYPIPKNHTVEGNREQLFLFNLETQSLVEWNHDQRGIAKVKHLPQKENQKVIDFDFHK
jgi:hypothetical protein